MYIAVPIGFTYIQFPFSKSPQELWPKCKFEDVTRRYAGKFFRAEKANGRGATEPFGNVQDENSPRLDRVKFMDVGDSGNWEAAIRPGQWSAAITSGNRDGKWVSMKFMVRDAEVRPANYAIRIFKNNGCEYITGDYSLLDPLIKNMTDFVNGDAPLFDIDD